MANKYIGYDKNGWIVLVIIGIISLIVPYLLFDILPNKLPTEFSPYFKDLIDQLQILFRYNLIISNGLLMTIIFSVYAFMKGKTLAKFIMQVVMFLMVFYFLYVGSNLLTLFLPALQFGYLGIATSSIMISLNYSVMIWLVMGLQSLYLVKSFLEFYNRHKKGEADD